MLAYDRPAIVKSGYFQKFGDGGTLSKNIVNAGRNFVNVHYQPLQSDQPFPILIKVLASPLELHRFCFD